VPTVGLGLPAVSVKAHAKQSEKVTLMSRKNSASPAYGPRLNVPVTTPLIDAVASAAAKQLTSMNSYVRSAVLAKLQSDGIKIEEVLPRAG
jgi:predicted HicB family RNase H-like nuclease